jgi:hypothetical protein
VYSIIECGSVIDAFSKTPVELFLMSHKVNLVFTFHSHLNLSKQRKEMGLRKEDDSVSQNEADAASFSSTSLGSGNLTKTPAKNAEDDMRNKIIYEEEKSVRNARAIVIVAGIFCALAVGAAINIFAHNNDQAIFELEVRKSARLQNHPYLLLLSRKRQY